MVIKICRSNASFVVMNNVIVVEELHIVAKDDTTLEFQIIFLNVTVNVHSLLILQMVKEQFVQFAWIANEKKKKND